MTKDKREGIIVVGLDVGTTKIATVVAEILSDRQINVIGEGTTPSLGVKKGVVVDIESTIKSIERSVEKAERMSGVEIEKVYVGVSGEHIYSLNSQGVIAISGGRGEIILDDVERVQEAAKIISLSADKDIIHLIPRDYIIDGQNGIKNPVGMSGMRLEVQAHIVVGGVSFLQNLLKCVQRVGLVVQGLVAQPIASAEATLSADEKEIGVLMADMGGGATNLAIFREGSIIWTKVLPFGGSYIDRDIAYGLSTTLSEGERLKKENGVAMSSLASPERLLKIKEIGEMKEREIPQTLLSEIIEPRVTEFFEMIRQEVNKSTFQDLIPAGLVLTGGSGLLRGIDVLAREVLNIPCRIGVPTNLGGLSEQIKSPVYSSAVGLIIYGIKKVRRAKEGKIIKKVDIIHKIKAWIKDFIWPVEKGLE